LAPRRSPPSWCEAASGDFSRFAHFLPENPALSVVQNSPGNSGTFRDAFWLYLPARIESLRSPHALHFSVSGPPMTPIDEQIADLESLLNSGAESVIVDGVTTRFNLDQVRQRLRDLYREKNHRPQALTVRMSGNWQDY
jgi:hypothetical protein